MPIITGTDGNDTLTGTDDADEIFGLDGDDIINGGFGADRLFGGAGNDTFVFNGVGFVSPTPPVGLIDGGTGIDTIDARAISPTQVNFSTSAGLRFVAGNQTFNVSNVEIIRLGSGNDSISVRSDVTTGLEIFAGGGADRIVMTAGVSVYGENGDDTFFLSGSFGGPQLIGLASGGAGIDLLRLNILFDVDLAAGTAISGSSTFSISGFENVEAIVSANYDSTVRGDGQANVITASSSFGDAGSAFFDGRGGDDILIGNANSDTLSGGDDNDRLEGRGGADLLYGDADDDLILGGAGDDLIDGGTGNDTASFEDLNTAGVTADLTTGQAVGSESGTDTLVSIENLRGTDFADVLIGDANANRLEGRAGADILRGGGGNDYLDGGSSNDELFGDDGDDLLIGGSGDDIIDGGSGVDTAVFAGRYGDAEVTQSRSTITVNGTDGRDTLTNIEVLQFSDATVDVVNGRVASEARMTLDGTAGADTLIGGGSNDTLTGGGGDDVLRGNGGSNTLDGGAGFDLALYSGVSRQYIANSSSVAGGSEGGTDTLISIEGARFTDGTLSFDVDGPAAQIMRLFNAALDRQPDPGGFEGLLDELEAGRATLTSLADAFIASPEFQARYGALNNQQFVEQLYRFTLDREGDAAGVAGWVANLDAGLSRAEALVFFSESAEHRTLTQGTLNAGLWVADDQATIIARLYDATFDRLPDAAGLAVWTNNLKADMPLVEIAAAFASAQEFQDRYGALSNQQFVEQMYRFCLDREGDAAGVAGWVANMEAGLSRAEVLMFFSESAEHVALTRPLWLGGIQTLDSIRGPLQGETDKTGEEAQVLIGLGDEADTTLDAKTASDPAADQPQVNLGPDLASDPIRVDATLFDAKWADDAFVLPPLDEGKIDGMGPKVLPEVPDDLVSPTHSVRLDDLFAFNPMDNVDANGFAWLRADRGDDWLN